MNNARIMKRSHVYESYACTYNIDILNSFNLELQLKNTKFASRNKLTGLLPELKRFKFVATLDLEFKI